MSVCVWWCFFKNRSHVKIRELHTEIQVFALYEKTRDMANPGSGVQTISKAAAPLVSSWLKLLPVVLLGWDVAVFLPVATLQHGLLHTEADLASGTQGIYTAGNT